MTELHDWSREDELREPDWRWRLADQLRQQNHVLPRNLVDRAFVRAFQFSGELEAATTVNQRAFLKFAYPDLLPAWHIYTLPEDKQNFRWEIEARLLARQSYAQIARHAGLGEVVIKTYAGVFFDVQTRLDCPSFITHFVIRPARQCVAADYEPQVLWKVLGYAFGPNMVDFVINHPPAWAKSVSAEDCATIAARDARGQLHRHAILQGRSLDLPEAVATGTRKHFLEVFKEIQRMNPNTSEADSLRAGLQSLLENLPWTRSAAKALKLGSIHEFEKDGVGMRADELSLCRAGQVPPDLRQTIESAKYPAPLKRTTISS